MKYSFNEKELLDLFIDADNNSMLEFAVIVQRYDVLHLAFLGRMKG